LQIRRQELNRNRQAVLVQLRAALAAAQQAP